MQNVMWRRWVQGSVVCAVMSVTGVSTAADFRPFTPVQDVCSACSKRAEDAITMDNGTKVKARIEAENDDYLILSRYGEVRLMPKTRLTSVDWANNAARSGLTSQDQVILKKGHVITGTIIEENAETGLLRIQSSLNQQIYVVFAREAEAIYKAGTRR